MATKQADVGTLKDAIVRATDMLFRSGVMQHSGHGNLSARLDDDRMIITSGGMLQGLTASDLAIVTRDGRVVDGHLEPAAAEIVSMHACVYEARPNVGAVIHTHSPNATAFALANEPVPCAYEAMLRFGMVDGAPVAAWAPRGSRESVENIVGCLRAYPSTPAILLGNHGLLAFAADPVTTARVVIILEEAAGMTLGARHLGGEKAFPADALAREREHMARFGSTT
jgi:L-ribulose-5-phosphate 4-epimerase